MTDTDIPGHRELEDELLAVRCQLGDMQAFDALIRRWHGPISAYVRRQCGPDDAADIVQDIWLRVFRSIASLRDGRRLRAWLFGIARHAWMDRLRSRYADHADVDVDVDVEPDDIADPPDADDLSLEFAVVSEGLAQLPPIEREALTLFYLHELSLNEIAQVLEIPTGTVKSRLHRARRMLRHELHTQGVEP